MNKERIYVFEFCGVSFKLAQGYSLSCFKNSNGSRVVELINSEGETFGHIQGFSFDLALNELDKQIMEDNKEKYSSSACLNGKSEPDSILDLLILSGGRITCTSNKAGYQLRLNCSNLNKGKIEALCSGPSIDFVFSAGEKYLLDNRSILFEENYNRVFVVKYLKDVSQGKISIESATKSINSLLGLKRSAKHIVGGSNLIELITSNIKPKGINLIELFDCQIIDKNNVSHEPQFINIKVSDEPDDLVLKPRYIKDHMTGSLKNFYDACCLLQLNPILDSAWCSRNIGWVYLITVQI